MKRRLLLALLTPTALVILAPAFSNAGETSHYSPGVANIRDFQLGYKSGFWGAAHNFYYQSGRLNDEHGNETNLIVVRPGSGVFSSIDPDIDVYAMTLSLTWVKKEFLAKKLSIGAVIAPTLANSSVSASVSAETGQARDPITDQFGFGDLYVQPLWLGWTEPGVFSVSASWGFYAPTGEFDTELATDPSGNVVRESKLDVLRRSVGLVPCQACQCDSDSSGSITAGDALRTLRLAVGQSVSRHCGSCTL